MISCPSLKIQSLRLIELVVCPSWPMFDTQAHSTLPEWLRVTVVFVVLRTQTWWSSLSHLLVVTGTTRGDGKPDTLQVIKTSLIFQRGKKRPHVRNQGENLEHMFGIYNNLICSPKSSVRKEVGLVRGRQLKEARALSTREVVSKGTWGGGKEH